MMEGPANQTEVSIPETDGAATYPLMLFVIEVLAKWWPIVTLTLGFTGNVMSFLVMTKKENRQISCCIYMAGLSIVDSLVLVGLMLYMTLVSHGLGGNLYANLMFLRLALFSS
jgi:hypothetical protein